ncbi:hypothetical protein [Pelomonas cellulosilytica]|uniref:L,D-transpeptidase n=1 Tax=Pelomonas cellulosilytica TaxID=2906762 RepID=A0ABS8XUX2_9BURK|nr:hypothetical protein [Pelomonas sp. P8]MCE4555547.1 hypothetical protein [Pelomonas sp. P8]
MRFDDTRPKDAAAGAARRDILSGLGQGALIAAVALAVLYGAFGHLLKRHRTTPAAPPPPVAVAPVTPPPAIQRRLDFGTAKAPADVTRVAAWAVAQADNGDRPFAIVDKRGASLYVFDVTGKLLGTSPVLLGYAAGDLTVEGIGNKKLEDIKPSERTTPAGRFQSEPGRNAHDQDVVWVDYDAAVSMHRVINSNPSERRLQRLATPTPADNRISWGCINVPVAFFDTTLWPNIGKGRGVVYVLPERLPLTAFFPGAADTPTLAQAGGHGNRARP